MLRQSRASSRSATTSVKLHKRPQRRVANQTKRSTRPPQKSADAESSPEAAPAGDAKKVPEPKFAPSPLSDFEAGPLRVVDPSLIFGNTPFTAPSTTGVSVARYYTNVCATKPREYWDYSHHRLQYHSLDAYDTYRKIGRGKYSEVFAGIKLSTEEPVIMKILKPVKKKKVRRELLILQHLIGNPYCAQLIDVLKDPVNRITCVITRFNDGEDFKTLFPTLGENDVRLYMYQLLHGLDYAHSRGIMHRDIKPHNVVIDHERRILRIIDWGLGEFYHPNTEYNCRVASRYFKGPELLLNMKDYDYSVDMWSFGATMAGLTMVVHPFFNGQDNLDMINKISRFTGSDDMLKYMEDYKIADPDGEYKRLIGNYKKKSFDLLVNNLNKHLVKDDTIDLLSKILVVDHNQRLSAREAMAHPYFDPVRDFVHEQHDQLVEQLANERRFRAKVDAVANKNYHETDGEEAPMEF